MKITNKLVFYINKIPIIKLNFLKVHIAIFKAQTNFFSIPTTDQKFNVFSVFINAVTGKAIVNV